MKIYATKKIRDVWKVILATRAAVRGDKKHKLPEIPVDNGIDVVIHS